jgi:enoyl-CoA hydratase
MAQSPKPEVVVSSDPVFSERIELSTAGAVACLIQLNRPRELNSLNWDTIRTLERELHAADDDPTVRVVLITGRGRAFSSGGDLKSYRALQRDPVEFPLFLEDLHRTFGAIRLMKKPVVSLVNGVTAAGGLELILSCDFAIAASSARIGDAHLAFGQMGGGGILTLLPRSIGPARARELIFSARYLTSSEAASWGIVNRVVDDSELLAAGLEFAQGVATRSPLAVSNAKYVLNTGWAEGTGIDAALRLERERNAYYCLNSTDATEGLEAFEQKRRPEFRGS